MLHLKQNLFLLLLILSAACAEANCLWIIGDATLYGWNTDEATALLSDDNGSEFSGTIYLRGGQDFKFMTVPEWGNEEYGAAPGAKIVNGEVTIAKGTDDTGYDKLQVPENGNYYITINTGTMIAKIVKSDYQDTEITTCSLFLVGSATPEGWDVMKGTPLYQNTERPYEFTGNNLQLKNGTFKIAIDLKGACSWNPEFWYFCNATNDKKIARAQDGDIQWNIKDDGMYTVVVNVVDQSISIVSLTSTGVTSLVNDDVAECIYYTLTGVRVSEPTNGIYICKKGSKTKKIIIR